MSYYITYIFIYHPVLFLVFLVVGILGIKFCVARLFRSELGEEMKISIVATDQRTGEPVYMKVVHPDKVLQGRFLEHLRLWMEAVKNQCAKEGKDFTQTVKVVLPPTVQQTPEFERLLESYGLDPQHSVIAGPSA